MGGAQWDVICNWLADAGYSITDSTSWGNYNNSIVLANDGTTELKASGTSTKLETRITTYTMANNIYDFAGNCYEWSQEADGTLNHLLRGGDYCNHWSSNYPAAGENSQDPTDASSDYGTRPTLIVGPEH